MNLLEISNQYAILLGTMDKHNIFLFKTDFVPLRLFNASFQLYE